MILRNTLTIGLVTLGLFGCTEKTESIEKDEVEVSKELDQKSKVDTEQSTLEKETPAIVSFDNNSEFKISTNIEGEVTGTENFDFFLHNELFEKPILLTQDVNYSEVDTKNYSDIPKNSVFAFSTWYAGGGALYYGVVKNGVLQVYRKFEEADAQHQEFTLFREFDPNVQTDLPAYFIHYFPDNKKGSDIMIACTSNGKGLYAKYKGQTRHLAMQFLKDESEGKNIIESYDEVVKGKVNGTYKMTHSGNWDYLQYIYKESGKNYDFTINHDATIVGDTYRTTPSF